MKAGIAPGLDLDANYQIEFTALDATTGAVVTSVVVSSASLLVDNLGGGPASDLISDIEPLWVPVPVS